MKLMSHIRSGGEATAYAGATASIRRGASTPVPARAQPPGNLEGKDMEWGFGTWAEPHMGTPATSHGAVPGALSMTVARKISLPATENASLLCKARMHEKRIDELEHRFGLNSGKPPSSDGLKKPGAERRIKSVRRNSGRKPGSSPTTRARRRGQPATSGHIVEHVPET